MTFVRIQKILLALFRNILWTIKWWNLCICFMSGKSGTNSHLPPLQWHTFLSLKTQLFCHFIGPVHHPCLTDLQYVPYMCFTTIFVFQCCAHISMTYMCFMLYMCSNAKCMFNGIQSVSMPYMCFNAVHIFQCIMCAFNSIQKCLNAIHMCQCHVCVSSWNTYIALKHMYSIETEVWQWKTYTCTALKLSHSTDFHCHTCVSMMHICFNAIDVFYIL